VTDVATVSDVERSTHRGARKATWLWPGPAPTAGRDQALGQWRRGAGIFLIYLGYALVDLVQHQSAPRIALGAVLTVAFVWLYLVVGPRAANGGDQRRALSVLAGMAAVIAIYLSLCGGSGLLFVIYFVVFAVLILPPTISAPLVVVAAAAVTYGPQHVSGLGVHGTQYAIGTPCVLAGVTMFFLRNNRQSQRQLDLAREEIGRLAASQERLRIARDLHDLLGHALTTVTVKAELAARLVDRDPTGAVREMQQVAELARQGLADVRSTVSGYREVSLAMELATAREVLAAAGVRAELPASTEEVPGPLRTLFGWVVREGVTNAVRHAHAHSVRVLVTPSSVEVVDDGRGAEASATGSGLSGLAERVAAAGGQMSAAPVPGGGFRLHVAVPS
jgi:two-component system sensor histidine kinase DesK